MSSSLPLRHATVLDLTDEAGAQGARLLAELGARVIRFEASMGDALRRRPPFLDGEPGIERSLAHLLYNAGKESVALPLDVPDAWGLIDRLAAHADLVLAPLEKSALARRFFDERRLRAVHPDLGIVDVIFRREPLAGHESVTDLIGVAAGGLLYVNGFPDDPPDLPFGKLSYRQLSFTIASTATALLLARRRQGRSGIVRISLQEAVAMTTMQAANENLWRWQGAVAVRSGLEGLSYPVLGKEGQTALIRTSRTTYPTRDGKWVSFSLWPAAWRGFAAWVAEVTGSDALLQPAWDDPLYRARNRRETDDAIARLCAALPRDELVRTAQRIGLLALPINDAGDIARDEHLHQRGFYQDVEQPALGRVLRLPGSVFTSSSWGRPRLGPAPALGQHTAEVLGRLGGNGQWAMGNRGLEPDAFPRLPIAHCPLPLRGYRVVDFCWQAAGPLITRVLADLGAEVIKLETSLRVDRVREFHHPPRGASINTGAFFSDCNTNKQSFTVDFGAPAGIALAKELISTADVVTANFSPDILPRWGLGYQELERLRPGIIVASFPVMGASGPHREWRSIGNGVVALCGLAAHTGGPDRPPVGLGTLHTDFTLAPLGAMQIMAALLEREETGRGCFLEIAQYEAGVHLLDTAVVEVLNGEKGPARIGNRSQEFAPQGVFPCAGVDRWLALTVRTTLEWHLLCEALGRPDLATRPGLQSLEGRAAAADELDAAITAWAACRDPWDAASDLQACGVPASPVEHVGDLVDGDPGMTSFFETYRHPEGIDFLVMNQPWTWDGDRQPLVRAPLLGEHNERILRDLLGRDDEQIAGLVMDGVVR